MDAQRTAPIRCSASSYGRPAFAPDPTAYERAAAFISMANRSYAMCSPCDAGVPIGPLCEEQGLVFDEFFVMCERSPILPDHEPEELRPVGSMHSLYDVETDERLGLVLFLNGDRFFDPRSDIPFAQFLPAERRVAGWSG